MVQVTVKDMAGKASGTLEVPAPDKLSAQDYAIVARSIERQRHNARHPISHTLGVSEVSGGGKKPWRQKGTGRARVGTIRSGLWRHGAVIWGPTNEKVYSKGLNKKERKRAMRVALQSHAINGSLTIIDGLSFKKPRTAEGAAVIKGLALPSKKILLVLPNPEESDALLNTYKSFRNLPNVTVIPARHINALLLAQHPVIVVDKAAWEAIAGLWLKNGEG